MIKRWFQFIKESNHNWLSSKEIGNIFTSLKDEEYEVYTNKMIFAERENQKGKHIVCFSPMDDVITLGEYFYGYSIPIVSSKTSNEDMTSDFRSSINYLIAEGYQIWKIDNDDGEEVSAVDDINFINGKIIIKIGEDEDDENSYITTNSIDIYVYQQNKVEITPKDLAEIYNWRGYTTDKSENIYCELDIETLSDLVLSSRSSYKDLLINGIEYDDYFSSDYQPNIESLFKWSLDKENAILSIKALIKEYGGLEKFIKFCDENLEGMLEEEVINHLLKDIHKYSGNFKILEKICKDSEIIGDIRQTISDWESQAHCDRNQKELESEFDRVLNREGLKFTKSIKMGKKYYFNRDKQKVYYDDNVWFYQIQFEERWITDFDENGRGDLLENIFERWCYNCSFNNTLRPNFADHGYVDKVALNSEIKNILTDYLAK